MKYALLLWDTEDWAAAPEAERSEMYAAHGRFAAMAGERGALAGGAELGLSGTATTVRKGDGSAEPVVTDGPFTELAEVLGGFYVIEAADLDEALEYARAVPARNVEVRPVVEQADRP